MVKVLFVCTANICRSPTAAGVFAKLVEDSELDHAIEVDSVGTHAYHTGEPPDKRAQEAAQKRGYDLSAQQARRITEQDMTDCDYILIMDNENKRHVQELFGDVGAHKVRLFIGFAKKSSFAEIPDPYYGARAGFEVVLDLVEDASHGLLASVRRRYGLG